MILLVLAAFGSPRSDLKEAGEAVHQDAARAFTLASAAIDSGELKPKPLARAHRIRARATLSDLTDGTRALGAARDLEEARVLEPGATALGNLETLLVTRIMEVLADEQAPEREVWLEALVTARDRPENHLYRCLGLPVDQAIEPCRRAIEQVDRSPAAHPRVGQATLHLALGLMLGAPHEAVDVLEQLERRMDAQVVRLGEEAELWRPKFDRVLRTGRRIHADLLSRMAGREAAALLAVDQVLHRDGADVELLLMKGGLLERMGRRQDALSTIAEAETLAPADVTPILARGRLFHQAGLARLEAVVAADLEGAALSAADRTTARAEASAHLRDARTAFLHAVALEPDHLQAHEALLGIAVELGDERAQRTHRRALDRLRTE